MNIDKCFYCKNKLEKQKICYNCSVYFDHNCVKFCYKLKKLVHILDIDFYNNSDIIRLFSYRCYDLENKKYYYKYNVSDSIGYIIHDIMLSEGFNPKIFKKCIDKLPLILTFQ